MDFLRHAVRCAVPLLLGLEVALMGLQLPYGALLADVLLRPAQPVYLPRYFTQTAASGKTGTALRQYRIILSADTASEVRQLLSQKRR